MILLIHAEVEKYIDTRRAFDLNGMLVNFMFTDMLLTMGRCYI